MASKNPSAIEKVEGKTKRGGKRPNSGRKPGTPNKVTADARIAIAKFVDTNSARMQKWLDEVAKESPEKAFNMVRDLIEYHVPKLARSELTGPGGKDLPRNVSITIVSGKQ